LDTGVGFAFDVFLEEASTGDLLIGLFCSSKEIVSPALLGQGKAENRENAFILPVDKRSFQFP
jgi:hypothetical protein